MNTGAADATVENVKVVDTLGAGQRYVSSTPAYTSVDGSKYTYELGTFAGVKTITIVTEPTDAAYSMTEDGTNYVRNDADLFIENSSDKKASAFDRVPFTTNWIEKSGVFTARSGGNPAYIDWTVKLNNHDQKRTITAGSIFTDTLPQYLTIDPATPILRGGATPPAGDTVAVYTDKTGFTYTFGADTTDVVTLTFRTLVDDAYYQQQTLPAFVNKGALAVVIADDPAPAKYEDESEGVQGDTSLIFKAGGTYNAATQLLTWTIEVNRNGRVINGAYVVDKIGPNQAFYTDDTHQPTYSNGSVTNGALGLAATADAAKTAAYAYHHNGGTLTIGLGDLAAADHVFITFYTKATNPAIYAGNNDTDYTNNTTTLYGGGIVESSVSDTIHDASSEVISKASVANSYDYTNRTVDWTITVNKNKMEIPAAVVTDTILNHHHYVANSLLIDGAVPAAGQLGVSADNKVLTITLGTIDKQVTITYKTVITDENVFLQTNGDVKLENTARLTSTMPGFVPRSVDASYTIPNRPITKTGQSYVNPKGYITWTCDINPHRVNMVSPKLYDKLQSGLELDINSVSLIYLVRNESGALVPGDPVPSDSYSYQYNYESREFTLDLPSGANAYRLVFSTDVLQAGTYTNAISFTGSYNDNGGSSGGVSVSELDFSAGSGARTASITVYKTDGANPAQYLPGAIFQLLDSNKNVKQTLTTDGEGKAVFRYLKRYTYYIREIRAPLGYALDRTDYPVTISDNAMNPGITLSNSLLAASITMQKTGENPEGGEALPLSGGSFVLYAASDTAFASALQTVEAINGVVTFPNLPAGEYVIREEKAPLGYERTMATRTVTLAVVSDENDPNYNTLPDAQADGLSNALLRANITLQKTGENPAGGEALLLDGGSFALYAASDTAFVAPLQSVAADNGVVTFTNLLAGEYVIREEAAPIGYVKSAQTRAVTIALDATENAQTYNTLSVSSPAALHNDLLRADIVLRKTSESNRPLTGGRFGIYAANDAAFQTPLQIVGATNGEIRFKNLLAGEYKVREITAPYGYQKTSEVVEVSLLLDRQRNALDELTVEKPILNKLAYGTIALLKVDQKGKPLAGAKFGLYNSAGYQIDSATSDASGNVRFYNVLFGTYFIKELTAPAGYALYNGSIVVQVTDQGTNWTTPQSVANLPFTAAPQTGDSDGALGFMLLGAGLLCLLAALRRRRSN